MKVKSLLLIAGGLPTVFGTWYSDRKQCPSSAPTLPVTDVRDCDISSDKCSTSSEIEIKSTDAPSTCLPGNDVTIKVQLTAKHGESTRYDYSMWVPNTLGYSEYSPFEGAQCAVTVFPCKEGGDGDSCGDLPGTKYRRKLFLKNHSDKKGSGDGKYDSWTGRKGYDKDDERDNDRGNDKGDYKDDKDGDRRGSRRDRRGLGVQGQAFGKGKNSQRIWDKGGKGGKGGGKDDHHGKWKGDDYNNHGKGNDDRDYGGKDDIDDKGGSGSTETIFDEIELTVPCRSGDDGHLILPICVSWDKGDRMICSSPQFAPTDDCACEVIGIGDTEVCKPNGEVCDGPFDESCCHVCVEETFGSERYLCADEGASGDPHLVGFRGQKFDFTGADGEHYALLSQDDPLTLVTMRLQAPVPGLDVITYIVGFGIKAIDLNGSTHTVQAFVENPKDFYAHRECPNKNEPCLAEGALTVLLDGDLVTRPGTYELGPGFEVGAVNLPGECRSFGFEKYWGRKVREANEAAALTSEAGDGRRLESWAVPMDEWILGDSKVTNRVECEDFVTRSMQEESLFNFQSEYVSFQISTPALTVRVNHGKLHQLAMRDPTDRFNLPDHRTFQQNIALERVVLGAYPRGILGETVRPTRDASGKPITHGIEAMRGKEEDYRVSGAFMDDFALGLNTSPDVLEETEAVEIQ